MEGNSESTLPTSSPLTPTRYVYRVVVLNAHTGYEIGVSPLSEPYPLEQARGLDPALFARYPLEVSLQYTKDIADFPVSEPSSLPRDFSLARVTLALAHPLQDVLPYAQEPSQTVLQHYFDGHGGITQLAQFRGGLPDFVEGAVRTTVRKTKAWASHQAGESTWLAWTWAFPDAGAYVTYVLYSVATSISMDALHEIAASMPTGEPPPPTPEPVRAPTALPKQNKTPKLETRQAPTTGLENPHSVQLSGTSLPPRESPGGEGLLSRDTINNLPTNR